jgi:hypothetical protein
LKLKPDERFFKYQEKYFKHTLNNSNSAEKNNKVDNIKHDKSLESNYKTDLSPQKNSEVNNIKSLTINPKQQSQYRGLIYPYAISKDDVVENNRYKGKANSVNKLYQSEDNINKYVIYNL